MAFKGSPLVSYPTMSYAGHKFSALSAVRPFVKKVLSGITRPERVNGSSSCSLKIR